jgi:putative spermidine/putrescine transport system permease protein
MTVGRAALWAYGALVLAFLLAPIVAIVPLSFSSGGFLHYPLPGLSLRWYRDFAASAFWLPALWNSLVVAAGASAVATALGTLAAFGLWRAGAFPGRALVMSVLLVPLAVPVIVVAVALLLAFGPLGLTDSFAGLIVAHAALGAPFVVVTVLAALAAFDPVQLRAAAACGAGPVTAFRRVALPQIAPGVAAGAVFAFATSLDEFVITLFLAGPGQFTLPRQMYANVREYMTPTILAAASLLFLASLVLLLVTEALRRRQP